MPSRQSRGLLKEYQDAGQMLMVPMGETWFVDVNQLPTVSLQNGRDINKPIGEIRPPVFGYAFEDDEMALWLLERGADLNRQTYIDLTPMSYAVEDASPSLIKELLNRGGDVQKGELLQHALDRKFDVIEVLAALLDKCAPLNTVMYENHWPSRRLFPFMEFGTPLHKAAEMGEADIVRFLLGRGADVSIRNTKGRTAEECAEKAGYNNVVGVLESVSRD
ncbi:hypothetical protein DL769_003901 [Monosporascus sp. CRB-8-3]|nr:hypothetical protein DL769_003901 [Monosporascus sp. CRB-8-3]